MAPDQDRAESGLDRTFRISISLKGLDGLLEIVGGVILLFVAPATLQSWARTLTGHELAQDPHDFIANHLLHSASQLSRSTTLYGAVYLLSHGIAKVVLVVALLRNQLWAYPWLIALLGVFIVYQTYRMTYRFTLGLLLLTLFDIFVVTLTVLEYRKRRHPTPSTQPTDRACLIFRRRSLARGRGANLRIFDCTTAVSFGARYDSTSAGILCGVIARR
jgi:uncharacterized membrane protein